MSWFKHDNYTSFYLTIFKIKIYTYDCVLVFSIFKYSIPFIVGMPPNFSVHPVFIHCY